MQQRKQAWRYLAFIFAIFWIIFACVLILSDFPFLVVSMALTVVAVFSAIIVGFSWAYQNNW
jgi:uncharacterized membrane protein